MEKGILTAREIHLFQSYLSEEEKSPSTIEKYVRDARAFLAFVQERPVTKELTMEYKSRLIDQGYKPNSINSMLASLNSLFDFLGWKDFKVKNLKTQRQPYCTEDRELTKGEYFRLVAAAKNQPRLCLLLQTICGTGIRVSELQYFTVEAVRLGEISVRCKGKTRVILIPGKLQGLLLSFARQHGISEGVIFRTKSGKPLNRSNIWLDMKRLCQLAKVKTSKVFPHNLRKLFARTFYYIEKDIAKLADILGHSSINTTRIYIMTDGSEHRKKIERLGLII